LKLASLRIIIHRQPTTDNRQPTTDNRQLRSAATECAPTKNKPAATFASRAGFARDAWRRVALLLAHREAKRNGGYAVF